MLRRWQDGFYERKLYAQICQLETASSILLIFQLQFTSFCVPAFQDLWVFCLIQTPPSGFVQTGRTVF